MHSVILQEPNSLTTPSSFAHTRYRRLAECQPLVQFSDTVVQNFYSKFFPDFFAASNEPQVIEWVLLVDNSGSMVL